MGMGTPDGMGLIALFCLALFPAAFLALFSLIAFIVLTICFA